MSDVDSYLKALPPAQRKELERIRHLVKSLVPEAEEMISYGVPTFKYKNRPLFYFAAFKNHMSVFPGAAIISELEADLSTFKIAKGTIQFSEENPLPEAIVIEIVNKRLADIS